jgi:hypothetical protein
MAILEDGTACAFLIGETRFTARPLVEAGIRAKQRALISLDRFSEVGKCAIDILARIRSG